jgi:hypothetical protein
MEQNSKQQETTQKKSLSQAFRYDLHRVDCNLVSSLAGEMWQIRAVQRPGPDWRTLQASLGFASCWHHRCVCSDRRLLHPDIHFPIPGVDCRWFTCYSRLQPESSKDRVSPGNMSFH